MGPRAASPVSIFTPPWNRCSLETLKVLKQLGYIAVSRDQGSAPAASDSLPDIPITVDLHTRKEATTQQGWNRLLGDLKKSISTGCCGIMIHHRRMNDAAFDFLELLLKQIVNRSDFFPVDMRKLAQAKAADR